MTIHEEIFELLKEGSKTTKDLFSLVLKKQLVTKQAFYKSLRNLLAEEKITIHGKRVSISLVWIALQQKTLQEIAYTYGVGTQSDELLFRAEKTKYTFKTLASLDAFLSHLLLLLFQKTDGSIFTYNEHEWFSYGRAATNDILIEEIDTKRPVLVTVLHNTPLDKVLAKTFNVGSMQYFMSPKKIFPKDMSYAVIDDYVISIKMDIDTKVEIHDWFERNTAFTNEAKKEMERIVQKTGSNIVTLQKDEVLANKIKKQLGKYFAV